MAFFDDNWFDFRHFNSRMNKLLRQASDLEFRPLTDVRDKGDKFVIELDMPGLSKEDINIMSTPSVIEVSAEAHTEKHKVKKNYYYRERGERKYYREIPLPEEIKEGKISAEYKNGVLTITAPKKKATVKKKKAVKIKVR